MYVTKKERKLSQSNNEDLMEIPQKIYDNFSDFVLNNRVQKDSFLKDNPMYVTKEELIQCFQNVDYKVTDEDVDAIMVHHKADKTDYLLIEEFINNLTCWRSSEEFNKVLDHHIDLNINNLRNKSNKEIIKIPENGPKKKNLKIKKSSQFSSSKISNSEHQSQKCLPNKSKHYLKLAKQK
mmetsp:Transcript_29956/g.26518  ORF Transcript_29956/g.26518 Transcript_29956/m.26518 type:complete len:180 (-) Transcript_29956:560-1099(-)